MGSIPFPSSISIETESLAFWRAKRNHIPQTGSAENALVFCRTADEGVFNVDVFVLAVVPEVV